ncbi:programmed cell death protein 2-like [Chanos chanos]|uniref:Programmed cell death protein 2-like n=1 Tax=Chanos chanos TaxID=29144 RepID=A0A6J2WQA9_CHACN|nr:programmed cell death protein 2-like [Chanos chanos]
MASEIVLLGVSDGLITQKKLTSYFTNKLGDVPDPLPLISLQYPKCRLCDGILSHVVQVYCPLEASPHHRTINVFACTSAQCYGKSESWSVLRSQCLESEIKPVQGADGVPVKESPMSSTDWCEDADDWGMGNEDTETGAVGQIQSAAQPQNIPPYGLDVTCRLQDLSIEGREEHWPNQPAFQAFYISVVNETDFDGHISVDHANRLLKEYEKREGIVVGNLGSSEGPEEEKYEKTKARHGDAVFSRFMKKISLCPEQVLRYSWGGSPLFITEPPSNMKQMVPPCSHCGSPRVFEFQLMPAMVNLLHGADSNSGLALEFGTVLVYTCRSSCWTSGSNVPLQEYIFVQADPDQHLFK